MTDDQNARTESRGTNVATADAEAASRLLAKLIGNAIASEWQRLRIRQSSMGGANDYWEFNYGMNIDQTLAHLLVEVKEPDDDGSGHHTRFTYTYDETGRLKESREHAGNGVVRTTAYEYDDRNRITKILYNDSSYEQFYFGQPGVGGSWGGNENLLVAKRDRNGNFVQYRYDLAGRRTMRVAGIADEATALTQHTPFNGSSYSIDTCEYIKGTPLRSSCAMNGEKVDYYYDYRGSCGFPFA